MHDIRIFLEKNGQFGAVATLGKEKIYALGNTQKELISSLKEGINISREFTSTNEGSKFDNFLQNS